MASMRDIKRKIKSVASTQQITKAMNLVAASKLQRAKTQLANTRPFYTETQKVISSIASNSKGVKSVLLEKREVKNTIIIVITGDKGLCGGYNANISKAALKIINEKKNIKLITIGSKGHDYFKHRSANIIKSVTGISEKPDYKDAKLIGDFVLELYKNNEADEVILAYTSFISVLNHEPVITTLLPIDTSSLSQNIESSNSLMIYEPNEEEVLNYIIPKYINTIIYGALVESSTSELGARMTAMDAATENAEEMIGEYTLQFNRARQGAITQELTEIVSGANALA